MRCFKNQTLENVVNKLSTFLCTTDGNNSDLSSVANRDAALAQVGQRAVERQPDQRDHLADLSAVHDQRRRDDHAVADRAHHQAVVEA